MFDVTIIGSGPAGLTAAIYLLRSGKKVLILEAVSYGGQIINANDIENYPGFLHINGVDLANKMYEQVKELGAIIKYEKVIKINNNKSVITDKGNEYLSKAIIIATGTARKKLNLENEDILLGKGISYCATCDGHFYKDKIVMVNGGGNTAIEDAIYLSNLAKEVYLVHRRDSFKADLKSVDLLKEKKNIHFIYNSIITKINGNDKLESVEIEDNNHNKSIIQIDGLFIAIGQIPNSDSFKSLINVDNSGYIITNEYCHTNISGIYAIGDVRKKNVRQIVTATADGAIGAIEVNKYLNDLE